MWIKGNIYKADTIIMNLCLTRGWIQIDEVGEGERERENVHVRERERNREKNPAEFDKAIDNSTVTESESEKLSTRG